GITIAVAVALVAAAYIAFVWRPGRTLNQLPNQASSQTAPTKEQPLYLGGRAEPVTLPPLDASDTLVRTLVQALSESPAIMAWLPTDGRIRNFTVAVANIADGVSPVKHLSVLRPSAKFRIVDRAGRS